MRRFLELCFISLISVIGTLHFVNNPPSVIDGGTPLSFSSEPSEVELWKQEVRESFDESEKEVFGVKPTPDIVGPHPDPDKCICKGSGVIVHGDGHKTVCPYHGKKDDTIVVQPLKILEE